MVRRGDKKNHSGKLFNKITNLKQKLRKRKKAEEEFLLKRSKEPQQESDSADVIEAKNWLTLNKEPWITVLQKWRDTFCSRKRLLRDPSQEDFLLQQYPQYFDRYGYQLVIIIKHHTIHTIYFDISCLQRK